MRRGSDEFGIESICEAATPIIINNKTGLPLYTSNEKKPVETNGNIILDEKNIVQENSDTNASIFDVFK